MAVKEKFELERVRFPEQVGISSAELKSLIDEMKNKNVEVHSMMMIRHGKVAFESWSDPYAPDVPHTMYSVSKSFVSTAIGFAVSEGLVSLDTKVIDLFPEYAPKERDENLEKMTVFHLLTMSAGKDVSVLSDKKRDDWVGDFFKSRWGYTPGEKWSYISENTYMCCVIIKKLTGLTVREYLAPRLFEPLGIDRVPFWECDHHGIEAGGWGLFITTEELARFILCLEQNGKFNGRQVIPEDWVSFATSKLVDNGANYEGTHATAGYGAFFWRNGLEGTYRADGMFSQYGVVFPEQDACFIFTASEIDEDKTRNIIFNHFPAMFTEECDIEPEGAVKGLALEPMEVLPAKARSNYEILAEGRRIVFAKNPLLNVIGFPPSMLPLPVTYMSAEKGGNIENVVLHFSENECTMTWDEGREHNTIVCGMDGKYRKSAIRLAGIDFTAVSTAAWENANTLEIRMRPLESICERRIKLKFSGNSVKLSPGSAPDTSSMADYIKGLCEGFLPGKLLTEAAKKVLDHLDLVLDAPLYGRMN